jgi:hypothetical protein
MPILTYSEKIQKNLKIAFPYCISSICVHYRIFYLRNSLQNEYLLGNKQYCKSEPHHKKYLKYFFPFQLTFLTILNDETISPNTTMIVSPFVYIKSVVMLYGTVHIRNWSPTQPEPHETRLCYIVTLLC